MLATLKDLAKMLGMSESNAGNSLSNWRAAKAVISRRSLFAASAAMATGACFSFAPERKTERLVEFAEYPLPAHVRVYWNGRPIAEVKSVHGYIYPPTGGGVLRCEHISGKMPMLTIARGSIGTKGFVF